MAAALETVYTRRQSRFRVAGNFYLSSALDDAEMLDLSRSGMLIKTTRPVRIGDTYTFHIDSRGQRTVPSTRVRCPRESM